MSGPTNTAGERAVAPLQAWWRGLSARDRRLALFGAAVLGLALLWFLALQPALATLARAPAERDRLDAELQAMQRLAAETQQLRTLPPVSPEQAQAALKAATERLGDKARLVPQGDRAVLTLNGVGSGALRDWLAEARSGARARALEANLMRTALGYSGTVVLAVGGAN